MNKTKKCSRCKEIKSISSFSKNKARYDGVMNICKSCAKINGPYSDSLRKYRNNRRFSQLKKNAKKRNIEVGISLDFYNLIMHDKKCYYCDACIEKETGAGVNRVDSSVGYMEHNIVPCCGKCNTIMSNFTKQDLKSRVYKIIKRM